MDDPLWRRLEAFADAQRAFGSPFADAFRLMAGRFERGEVGLDAPQLGDRMADFLLPDQKGRLTQLAELTVRGPVIVSFNRGHWCPFCRIELTALAQAHAEFANLGAQIVSITPDRQAFIGRLPREVTSRLTILCDIDNAYALSLGLAMWLGDELQAMMMQHGVNLEETQGSPGWIVPVPATFVLAKGGRIIARKVEPDFRQRLDIEDIRRALVAAKN
jgi:peroxiredoxin